VDYDPEWPQRFRRQADKIARALGKAAHRIDHLGSTSVPEFAASPAIDVVLEVDQLSG
jgi:GrpB-like predicted nucleotidyltransferase (UPF0157 family)